MVRKKLTIDVLGRMIKKGFDGVDKRFDKFDQTLKKHAVMLLNHGEALKDLTDLLKDHTQMLGRIEKKLEGIVYRREFEELEI
jgi:hypothetical protein